MNIAKKTSYLFFGTQFIAFFGLAALALSAHAQPAESQSLSLTPDQIQNLHKLQQKMQATGQQLNKIRQETMKAEPELQNQQKTYQSLLFKTMKEQGNDPDPVLTRMHEIEEQFQGQDLAEDKRQQLMIEYQQKNAQLRKAGQDAMQDKGVRQAAEDLSQATVVAMRKQDPKVETLLQEMDQLRKEMQQIVSKAKEGVDGKK